MSEWREPKLARFFEENKLNVKESMTDNEFTVLANVIKEVIHELDAQVKKWGQQDHDPLKWLAIAGEEYGEACQGWLKDDPMDYRHELLQLAAVCIHAVDCLDRNTKIIEPPTCPP